VTLREFFRLEIDAQQVPVKVEIGPGWPIVIVLALLAIAFGLGRLSA